MGGLVLDVVIAYFIKLILRLRRGWGSSKWKLVKARVDSSRIEDDWVSTVEVAYTYDFDGHIYSGIDSNPFLSDRFAKERVELFQPGQMAMVRVNQLQPQRSFLKRSDQ
ncbi:MAG TPA: DUF3592 domain-containing protein [Candidatus Angelobacter sp.]|nr:DUF3592 domain-containing protein [Candidatus Angelobacter sp.]